MTRLRYANNGARVIFNSYEPMNLTRRAYPKWRFAVAELVTMALIGAILAVLL